MSIPPHNQKGLAAPPFSREKRVAALGRDRPTRFDITPDETERSAVQTALKLLGLKGFRLKGALVPAAKDGWRVDARLTAIATQPCIITLEPVVQTIDETVLRRFVRVEDTEQADEIDLDPSVEDDIDPFGNTIDLGALATEALALALEPYPRKPGAEMETNQFTEPGVTALTDDAVKPFAQLSELKKKLSGDQS